MNNRTKGVLLSGLVFPGLGQFIQGRNKEGIIFVLAAVLGLIAITYSFVHKAIIIFDKLRPQLESGVQLNAHEIIKTAALLPNNLIDTIGPILFIACWLAATVNAFFVSDP